MSQRLANERTPESGAMPTAGERGFRVIIRETQPHERREVQARSAAGSDLGSDVCVGVWLDARLVGWGDDYGTFHPLPAPTSTGVFERAGEALLAAAVNFWEVEDR